MQLMEMIFILCDENPKYIYTLNQQIIRSCLSIGSNVVEGRRRTKKEFCRYLDIAIGSADECMYQLQFYKNSEKHITLCNTIIARLITLKKSVQNKPTTHTHHPPPQ